MTLIVCIFFWWQGVGRGGGGEQATGAGAPRMRWLFKTQNGSRESVHCGMVGRQSKIGDAHCAVGPTRTHRSFRRERAAERERALWGGCGQNLCASEPRDKRGTTHRRSHSWAKYARSQWGEVEAVLGGRCTGQAADNRLQACSARSTALLRHTRTTHAR